MLRLVSFVVVAAAAVDATNVANVAVDVGAVVFIPLIRRCFRIHDFLVKQFFLLWK